MQKEQLFLTFGSFAAHVQTHFWNAQESYFDYGHPDTDEDVAQPLPPLVDHDVCFRAGLGVRGEETYLPRTLLFDLREEFGTLRNVNRLYDALGGEDEGDEDVARQIVNDGSIATWGHSVDVLYTGPRIPQSRYQHELDNGDDDDDRSDLSASDHEEDRPSDRKQDDPSHSSTKVTPASTSKSVRRGKTARRYWSDYARVPFHPRSLIRVGAGSASAWGSGAGSDPFLRPMRGMTNELEEGAGEQEEEQEDGRRRFETYEQGHRTARQLDKDQEVSDDNLRWFAEDSDSLQAFNLTTTSSDAFSGFSAHYAESVRDEYAKTDLLVWATEWGTAVSTESSSAQAKKKKRAQAAISGSEPLSGEELRLARVRRMNQALSAASLSDSASLYIPLTLPQPSPPAPTQQTAGTSNIHMNPRLDIVSRMVGAAAEMTQKRKRTWDSNMQRARWSDMWHSAALLAAHIETSTLPSRLRDRPESIPQLTSRLNWRQNTRVGILGGCLPTPLLAEIQHENIVREFDPIEAMLAARGLLAKTSSDRNKQRNEPWTPEFGRREVEASWVDFLPPAQQQGRQKIRARQFAQTLTARDADVGAKIPTQSVMEAWSGLPAPLGTTHFVPLAYNILPSHPQFFNDLTNTGRALPDASLAPTNKRVRTMPLVSGLSTGPQTAAVLLAHRRFVQDVLRGHVPLQMYGIGGNGAGASGAASSEDSEGVIGGRDGLKEVLERLEEMLQGYEGEGADGDDEDDEGDGRGTDEEWVENGEEWDLE
ncbi:unnamed protein product [Tilletia controversa]|uniref:Tubulin nucleotide-binding domain-like protein n=3 Tax=Tilletia TaxID=13289 RepID=A0A8X7MRF2_9BASI|nr:hypothetical protein CF335_g6703 [Tilletia laevis]KAE8194921.1 hypothetical protein CF328_g4602 [Tilletia controversa]KAE8258876.1 hypothetical protein A4X03_0g4259 [Tilletia caries]KAE8191016.1 hypothetical protein CF336_g5050 [Tilletia laevis]KAE8245806.1 hypothetical protein A4X06_0g5407 [Tilletia controversa]